jgi:hypothetical protein
MSLKTFKLKPVIPGLPRMEPKFTLKKVEVPDPTPEEQDTLEEIEEKTRLALKKISAAKAKLVNGGDVITPKPKKEKKKTSTTKNMDKLLGEHIHPNIWVPRVKACFVGEAAEKDVKFISSPESVRFDAYKEGWRVVVMSEFGGEFCVTLFYAYGKGFNTKKISVEYIDLENLQHAVNWIMESRQFFNTDKYTREGTNDN